MSLAGVDPTYPTQTFDLLPRSHMFGLPTGQPGTCQTIGEYQGSFLELWRIPTGPRPYPSKNWGISGPRLRELRMPSRCALRRQLWPAGLRGGLDGLGRGVAKTSLSRARVVAPRPSRWMFDALGHIWPWRSKPNVPPVHIPIPTDID